MKYICIDLEMSELTQIERSFSNGLRHEVIQIGAIMVDENFKIISKFNTFVKPEFSQISSFLEELTGISNSMVEDAPSFLVAFDNYVSWVTEKSNGDEYLTFCWSPSDYNQLFRECSAKGKHRKELINEIMTSFVDLQSMFGAWIEWEKPVSLDMALSLCEFEFVGDRHSAYYDAVNTSRILFRFLQNNSNCKFPLIYKEGTKSHKKRNQLEKEFVDLYMTEDSGENYFCSLGEMVPLTDSEITGKRRIA